MRGCETCGRIYAPTRAPEQCECGGGLRACTATEAAGLAAARRLRLRSAAETARGERREPTHRGQGAG